VLGFVLSVLGILVVAALLFLGASLLLGRGETQPPADLDRSPVELPDDRPVIGDDVRALRMSVAVRGYRMSEVDWLLEQFAQAIDERDAEIVALRAQLRERAKEDASADTADDEGPAERPDPADHPGRTGDATTEDDDEEIPRA
jgi:DivIVA domain-containing protein